jgi:hypothetical protein
MTAQFPNHAAPPTATKTPPRGPLLRLINTMGAAFSDSVLRRIQMGRQVLLPSRSRQRRDRGISTFRNLSHDYTTAFLPSPQGKNRRHIRNRDHLPALDREAVALLWLLARALRRRLLAASQAH